MFSGRRIIDYGSHYMLGRVKGRWAPSGAENMRRRRRQKHQLPRASFSHFLELDFGGQQLEEATQSAPRCGGVERNAHTVLHVRASGDGLVSLAMRLMR